jgi:TAG lipase/steryl ester hydrolase/phospholipase A2/LPA acyltransferase
MWLARIRLREVYAALDGARSYAEWLEAAEAHDRLTGADTWREDDSSPHYDVAAIRGSLEALRRARERGDPLALAALLNDELYRHLNDLSNPALYEHALAGTKRLVERYLAEAEACLEWLAIAPGVPRAETLARFEAAWKAYGHTALLLSGGATLGFHHLGVVKALHQHDLLPHILSGASTGAMIAAGICARTDAEIDHLFAHLDELRLDGLKPVGVRKAAASGAWLDPDQLYAVLRHNVGDFTFAEAFARSQRALNISVSPARTRQKPRLLTHLTAPDVLVASAALASSALPGLFPPVVLEMRDRNGQIAPYIPSERWVDGSLYGDLPKLRLSRLHNVNHFIVSQTNPHVLPFVRHHGENGVRAALFGLTSATVRTQGAWATDAIRRLNRRSTGPTGRLADQLHALVSQDYGGDIDLHPQFSWRLYRKVVQNPTREDLADFVREGERSVWPRLPLIRNQTRLGRTFRRCVDRLKLETAARQAG